MISKLRRVRGGLTDHLASTKKRKLNESDKEIAKFVRMKGITATSRDFKAALNFARTSDPNKEMVLFTFCI